MSFERVRGQFAPKRRAATAEEVERLVEAARRHHPREEVLILLAADSGLRRAEIWQLRVSDVQGKRVFVARGKCGTSRYTILTERTARALKECLKLPAPPKALRGPEYVCRCSYQNLWCVIEDLKARAGLPEDLCWHSLRHYFGMRLASAGMPIGDISTLMGHTYMTSTLCYMHATGDREERALEALDEVRPVGSRFRLLRGGVEE